MTTTDTFWYFESVNLFKILCPQKIKKLADTHTVISYKKDQFISMADGSTSTHLCLIVNGRVKIVHLPVGGGEGTFTILTQGEIFGELATAVGERNGDFAQAMEGVTICPLTTEQLKELMYDNKELSFKILKLIGLRIIKIERKLEILVFKNARTRVVEFLKDTAVAKGVKVGAETMIPTKLTHKDIASLTGTSKQVITTILNDLKDKNLINFNRKQISISDLETLN
ncbi:MAG: Crp/Fnr family transcriptional regulator [Chryseolinea sp.]